MILKVKLLLKILFCEVGNPYFDWGVNETP
jgi:hypothetical protein